MTREHQELLRALIAAQVAVIEHADEDVNADDSGMRDLETCVKEVAKRLAILTKST